MFDNIELQAEIARVCYPEFMHVGTAQFIKQVCDVLYQLPEIRNRELHTNIGNWVAFKNCLLNLDDLTCYDHNPSLFITCHLDVSLSNINYCTNVFDCYLFDLAGGNQILITRIWETIGYILSNDISAKRFVFLQGHGNTGKSVFGNLLELFFDEKFITNLDVNQMSQRFMNAEISTAHLNINMDLPDRKVLEDAISAIKKITGQDRMSAEKKYNNPFNFRSRCKLIFASNFELRVSVYDESFDERILLIPCNYPVPKQKQDKNLLSKLKSELRPIAYKALIAFAKVRKNNYVFTGDDIYSNCLGIDTKYEVSEVHEEIIKRFILSCCTIHTNDSTKFSFLDDIFNAYLSYCISTNTEALNNKNSFSKKLHSVFPVLENFKKRDATGIPKSAYKYISIKA